MVPDEVVCLVPSEYCVVPAVVPGDNELPGEEIVVPSVPVDEVLVVPGPDTVVPPVPPSVLLVTVPVEVDLSVA